MTQIALLGDSVIDNKAYAERGPDVTEQARALAQWKVTSLAVDGATACRPSLPPPGSVRVFGALHRDVEVTRLEFHFDSHKVNGAARVKFVGCGWKEAARPRAARNASEGLNGGEGLDAKSGTAAARTR